MVDAVWCIANIVPVSVKSLISVPVIFFNPVLSAVCSLYILDDIIEIADDTVVCDGVVFDREVKMKALFVVGDTVVCKPSSHPLFIIFGIDIEGFGIVADLVVCKVQPASSLYDHPYACRTLAAEDLVVGDVGILACHGHDACTVVAEEIALYEGMLTSLHRQPMSSIGDVVVCEARIMGKNQRDVSGSGNVVVRDDVAVAIPDLECIATHGLLFAIRGDAVVGDVGIIDPIHIDAVETVLYRAAGDRAVRDLLHSNSGI